MDITIENKISYLLVTANGPLSLVPDGWKKIDVAREKIVRLIRDTAIFKLLIDCQALSGKISTVDRFQIALLFVKENIGFIKARFPPLKIAMVITPLLVDPQRFGERVANNRGLYGLVTTDMPAALKWLDDNGLNETML